VDAHNFKIKLKELERRLEETTAALRRNREKRTVSPNAVAAWDDGSERPMGERRGEWRIPRTGRRSAA